MDKLTLQVSGDAGRRAESLYDCLLMRINTTLHNSSLEYRHYKGYSEIVLGRPSPQVNKSAKWKKEWQEAVCLAVADYILDHCEEELLRTLIKKDKRYAPEETEEILSYCQETEKTSDAAASGLKEENHGRTRRRGLLIQDLASCMKKETVLNVDGFLRFRTGKYGAELKEILEYASDEYLMDQQYKEFISLLRYFVYIQESKIPVAHIMHKGGHEFLVLNEHMKPIDTEPLDTTYKVEFLDKDYNLEDLIVSTLITIAPERIYIHTREPELAVIKTISQIFEERAEICEYCRMCSSILGENSQQNKLSP